MGWYEILQKPGDVDKTPPINGDILVYDSGILQWKPAQISTIGDTRYLKLDQSSPQTVINGAPQFNEGITIKEDKFIYLDGV